jgi:hypothetical protein
MPLDLMAIRADIDRRARARNNQLGCHATSPLTLDEVRLILDRAIAAEALLHRCVRAMPPGPQCRDCADHDGTCQSDGKTPCDPREALPQRIAALAAYRSTKEQP